MRDCTWKNWSFSGVVRGQNYRWIAYKLRIYSACITNVTRMDHALTAQENWWITYSVRMEHTHGPRLNRACITDEGGTYVDCAWSVRDSSVMCLLQINCWRTNADGTLTEHAQTAYNSARCARLCVEKILNRSKPAIAHKHVSAHNHLQNLVKRVSKTHNLRTSLTHHWRITHTENLCAVRA